MSSHTHVFRPQGPQPQPAPHGTMAFGPPPPSGPRLAFEAQYRVMRSACLEERRPGVFLFAVEPSGRAVGRMWLAATHQPRVATLGRHEAAQLTIGGEAALSLRHLLFVVRRCEHGARYTLLDLESSSGLHTLHGEQRVLEAEGPALLRTARLSFFCVPTGPTCELPLSASAAWPLFSEPPPAPSLFAELLARPAQKLGVLRLHVGADVLPLQVDSSMARRGVLLGRDARCDVITGDGCASRVHAVVVSFDGVLHLVDAGSSNGTWTAGGERVRCEVLRDGCAFYVGRLLVTWST